MTSGVIDFSVACMNTSVCAKAGIKMLTGRTSKDAEGNF